MSATISKINKELKRHGYRGEIVRGDGYHYFVGDDFDYAFSATIPVMYTRHLTVDECLVYAAKFRKESHEKYDDIAPPDDDPVFYVH